MLTIADHLLSPYEEDAALISLLHVKHLEAMDYDTVDDHYRVTFSARAAWTEYGEEPSDNYDKEVYITLLYDYEGGDDLALLDILFQYEDEDDDYVPLRYTCPLTVRIFAYYETVLVQFLAAIGVR